MLLFGLFVSLPAVLAPFSRFSPLSGIGPVLGVRAPFPFPLVSSFFLVLSLSVCLPPGLLACPTLLAVSVYLGSSLAFVILCCFVPLGLVPGLSGRRLVQDFQHRPFPPTNFIEVSALSILIDYLFLLQFPRKDSSVVLLAVDWSGVSPHWTPQSISFQHCLWP